MDDTKNSQEDEIMDAEIVSEDIKDSGPAQSSSDQATILLSLDELIKSHVATLERVRNDVKKQKEMLSDGFLNSEAFREADEKAKEAAKAKAQVRSNLMQQPAMLLIANKVKGMAAEIKEKQTALSDYLLEYQRLAGGVNEIEGTSGEIWDIINSAKLVKRSSRK